MRAQCHAASQWPTRRFPLVDPINRQARRAPRAAAASAGKADVVAANAVAVAVAGAPPPLLGADLVAWCREQGAVVHPAVELVYRTADSSSTTVRTLRVSAAVRAGEHLAVVPARLCVGDSEPPPPSQQQQQHQQQPSQPPRALVDACPPGGGWQWRSAVALLHHALSGDDGDGNGDGGGDGLGGGNSSPLKAGYLPHLPGRAPGVPLPQVPLLWSPAELRELQGTCPRAAERQDASEERRALARDHLAAGGSPLRSALAREARAAGDGSAAEAGARLLAWALAVVTSRSFGLAAAAAGSSGRRAHLMAPLVDMADHVPEGDPRLNAEVRAFSPAAAEAGERAGGEPGGGGEQERQRPGVAASDGNGKDGGGGDGDDGGGSSPASMAVVLRASRDISPGEAVAICYGNHGPADTLLSYGFVPRPPPPLPPPGGPATATVGPPCHAAWDPDLLLAAFEALVAGAGPGVTRARDLPGWQRRALEALFAADEPAAAAAGAAAGEAAGEAAAAVAPARGEGQAPPALKRSNGGSGGGGGRGSGGFGAPAGARAAAERKATPKAAAAATVRLGGDPRHTVDARLAGAARLLALTKQDPAVAAAVRALAEGGGRAGRLLLCAPMPGGGGGSGGDSSSSGNFPVSAAHEAVAARALSGYTALVYKRAFRTTIQEDERLLREAGADRAAAAAGASNAASAPPAPSAAAAAGRTTARDRQERRELALRFRLSAKRELERVAQALSAHMRRALEEAP